MIDRKFGLLSSKTAELLNDNLWNIGFYGHIVPGGLALLIGWLQFNNKLRKKNVKIHRVIGKAYVISVLVSGICGLYIALFATGGIITKIGFSTLGIIWLSTTILGFIAIKKGNRVKHENYMIFSFAACFAAVTLRVWLPVLTNVFGEFIPAYRIVSWLCWVPNLIIAYFIVRNKNSKYKMTPKQI
ncbi:hypothetical protein GCM10011506_18370 [Marivirga lumbricoides]|uniref:DUF2306 domain-containing protein n=2 Tax=Marivirga lumbricoides TaxID=1046115 RepID=A0ABQ1M2K3_9BACT|nr:hypothetical protein GCM10011506_18370 [Marivirga lumbricoides]